MTDTFLFFAYAMLILALCAVPLNAVILPPWMPSPWAAVFALSIVFGIGAGLFGGLALPGLGWFGVAAFYAQASRPNTGWRLAAGVVTALLALALATHRVPGFHNPVVIAGLKLSADAAPFTQYANYDKGAVGLLLLVFICQRSQSWAELRSVLARSAPVVPLTLVAVLGASLAVGFVKPDFKLPAVTAQFLTLNLFLTVIAEEAFFRGFLQHRLALVLARFRHGGLIALAVSALLFGAAHAGGGVAYILLAMLAGVGYGYAYYRTQRIEAPILVHFLLNAVHFIGFTYPYVSTAAPS